MWDAGIRTWAGHRHPTRCATFFLLFFSIALCSVLETQRSVLPELQTMRRSRSGRESKMAPGRRPRKKSRPKWQRQKKREGRDCAGTRVTPLGKGRGNSAGNGAERQGRKKGLEGTHDHRVSMTLRKDGRKWILQHGDRVARARMRNAAQRRFAKTGGSGFYQHGGQYTGHARAPSL